MVFRRSFVFLGLLLALFTQCAEEGYSPPEGWLKHENSGVGYVVYYPPTWNLSNQGNPDLVFYVNSPKTGEEDYIQENVNLISQVVMAGMDVNVYIEQLEAKAAEMMPMFNKVMSEPREFKGFQAVYGVYEAEINGTRVKWEQYVWIKDTRSYMLTYSAEIIYFENYKKTAHEIINSLRFY